ncbi:S41 family peptidase [Bacteroidales bacterium OttesenSCG-928-I14]|nr:S41 family peptidase [Bacteroidales bacterium OttesenSCG-928-I14]
MKRLPFYLLVLLFISMIWSACIDIDHYEDSPRGNFELLWKIMDEHYCFFEYKEVDWDKVYEEYSVRISDDMNDESLFNLLAEMLAELKDGHVNLVSPFDVGRYWSWYENYPTNYDENLIKNYLGTDYKIASGLRYKILEDNIGYIRYEDFSSPVGEGNLDYVIESLSICDGIILDVRNNGGGYLSTVDVLASRFLNEETHVGYVQHKTGKGRNDFSEPVAKYVKPSTRLRYQKPVIVLTNRSCYSATNDFVNAMKYCPKVSILGDKTGGGSGLPFSSELVNGWSVRFSACPMYDAEMNHLEFGIEPDIYVSLLDSDIVKGKDSLIEEARNILHCAQE